MTIKNFYTLFVSCVLAVASYAQAPEGYYNPASGKSAAALKTALFGIIHNHNELSYGDLWTAYYTTDKRPDGKVWDMYSDVPNGTPSYVYTFGSSQCGSYSGEGNCYNREHSFPKSWFGDATPMYSDLFHLYPTDGYVNGKRSNYPYGEVGIASFTSTNGSKLGQCTFPGYTGTVFEPIDEYKGDLARGYFYMATCYEDKIAGWVANAEAQPLLAGNSYPAFKEWMINLLLKWSRQDPVSQKEIDRNNAVYGIQGNRNPYIDHPELVEYIWGNKTSETFVLNGPAISLTPSGAIDFGKNVPASTSYKTIKIQGYNITADINLNISGTGASKFTVTPTFISKDDALAGKDVTISYSSADVSDDVATLKVYGGGATDVVVNLTGKSSNDFLALPATETTSTTFKANWTKSDNATGYILDVYQTQQSGSEKQVIFDYNFPEGIPSTCTTSGYAAIESAVGALRLASGSNPGSITTPAIGTSEETTLTINAKQYNNDAGASLYVSVGGVALTTITTTSSFQDYVVTIPANNSTSKITLSASKGVRVYLSSATLETIGSTAVNTSITGFPVTLGNVLSYTVGNLSQSTKYYYTVTPIGGSDVKSAPIEVTTTTSSSITQDAVQQVNVFKKGDGFVVEGISGKKTISVYDMTGKLLKRVVVSNSTYVPFVQKGSYVISVDNEKFKQIF